MSDTAKAVALAKAIEDRAKTIATSVVAEITSAVGEDWKFTEIMLEAVVRKLEVALAVARRGPSQ